MQRVPRHSLFDYPPVEVRPPKLQPNGFAKLARFSYRNAALVLIAWCVFIALAGFWSWQKFSTTEQLPVALTAPSKPAEDLKILNQNFPHLESLTTITLSNNDPDELKLARAALVSQLDQQKDKFDLVFAPGTGDYYDSHAMLYRSKDEIEARVAYALSLRPLFNAIAEAPSVDSLSTLVGEVSSAIKQGRDPQGLDELFRQSAKSLQALMQGNSLSVDWTKIAGLDVELAPKTAMILALPKSGQNEPALAFVKETLTAFGKKTATRASLEQIAPQVESIDPRPFSQSRTVQAALLAGILTLIGLLSAIGRINLILMSAISVAAALVTAATASAFLLPTNMQALWPVFIGLALTALIIATRLGFAAVDAMSDNRSSETAIMLAAQKQGSGLVWQSVIAAAVWAGFLALRGKLGFAISGIAFSSIMVSLLASIMVVPAIAFLSNPPLKWSAQDWIVPLHALIFDNFLWRNLRSALTLVVIGLACAGLYFAPRVMNATVLEQGADQPVNIVAGTIAETQLILQKLKSIPQAQSVRWLGGFLPQDVEAKQAALAGLKDQFPRIGPLNPQTPDDLRDQITNLQESLSEIAQQETTRPDLRDSADEFRRSLELLSGTSGNAEIANVENRLFGNFSALAERANMLASVEKPELETLDKRLKSLFLSPDNIYRLEVTPVQGQSNEQLAEILFSKGIPVAHPSLVAQLELQATKSQFTRVLARAAALGLIVMALGLGEAAGIISAIITALVVVALGVGATGFYRLPLQPELLLIAIALLVLLFNLVASVFLKIEISELGLPSAVHAIEAWLSVIVVTACIIPIFLLDLAEFQTSALLLLGGSIAITTTIGFVLRPLCLTLRSWWSIES